MLQALKELLKNQNIVLALLSFVLGYLIFLSNVFNLNETWWMIASFIFAGVYSLKFYLKKIKQWPDYYRIFIVLVFVPLILIIKVTCIPLVFTHYAEATRFLSYVFACLYVLGWVFSVVKVLADRSATIRMKEVLHISILLNFL